MGDYVAAFFGVFKFVGELSGIGVRLDALDEEDVGNENPERFNLRIAKRDASCLDIDVGRIGRN